MGKEININPDGVSIAGCKMIYAPKGQAGEYAPLAANPYRGCGNQCLYCYVPLITKQDRKEFDAGAVSRRDYLARLRKDAQKYRAAGIREDRICVDPGIGFGKTAEHNLSLIRHLGDIASLGFPVLVGPSRKRFLGAITGTPEHLRGPASAAAAVACVRHGAWMVRVHEVGPVRDALAVEAAVEAAP